MIARLNVARTPARTYVTNETPATVIAYGSCVETWLMWLAHLGEQAILNKEIYAQGPTVLDEDGNVVDDLPFAYQERFAEYRYHPSIITGKLRSTFEQSLDVWHLAQVFDSLPKLSPEFIEDNPPIKRVLAVQDEPEFIFDAYIDCKTTRPMPVYSVPGLVDHF